MTIDPGEVRRLARLASLELEDNEILRLASELSSVLEHCATVSNLVDVATDPIRPENGTLRDDEVRGPTGAIDLGALKLVLIDGERFFVVPGLDVGER